MSAVAETPARRRPRKATPARPAPRAFTPTVGALVLVVALLLAGIVAVQVATMRLNMVGGDLDRERQQMQAEVLELRRQLDTAGSSPRVAEAARTLGMVRAPYAAFEDLPRGP